MKKEKNFVHPSATIEKSVQLGFGNFIGAGTTISGNVNIGNDNYIGPFCTIQGDKVPVILGNRCHLNSYISIGTPPQHSRHKFELNGANHLQGKIRVGNEVVIREFVTVHTPTDLLTLISDNCYIMAYSHISHDTQLEPKVILSNNTQIAGFTWIGEASNIGLSTVIHQRSSIGAYSMVGMGSIITKDIPVGAVAFGTPVKPINRINESGLLRAGFSQTEIDLLKKYYTQGTSQVILPESLQQSLSKFSKFSTREKVQISIE